MVDISGLNSVFIDIRLPLLSITTVNTFTGYEFSVSYV
uniref:Uncharacterized protein n=1 Tax=Rhizophora mucronata TaxID=61149 RepID=A0A2P2PUW5_RHIMU